VMITLLLFSSLDLRFIVKVNRVHKAVLDADVLYKIYRQLPQENNEIFSA
jgi:hypothetical protein